MMEPAVTYKRALYISKSNQSFCETDISDLAVLSGFKNKEFGITGFLCFSKDIFFQYIEGHKDAIDNLLNNLKNDPRHAIIKQIETEENDRRMFSNWTMQYLSEEQLSSLNLTDYVSLCLLYLKNSISEGDRGVRLLWNQIRLISLFHDTNLTLGQIKTSL